MNEKTLLCHIKNTDFMHIANNTIPFEDPIFAFVSAPIKGVVQARTDLTYCRESICEYIRQQVKEVAKYQIDTKALHMVMYRRVPPKTGPAAYQRQMEAVQNMLNVIESHYGWPLTKVYNVKLQGTQDNGNPTNRFYYLKATKRWMKSPAMLSMYLLLVRIACTDKKHKFNNKITSFDTLFETLDELAKRNFTQEVSYYREHGKHWRLILDNYRTLFGDRTMESLYVPSHHHYLFSEGINKLCDDNSSDLVLNKVMQKIVKKKMHLYI